MIFERPVAVLKPSTTAHPGRKLSECIALAKAYEEAPGFAPVPDAENVRHFQMIPELKLIAL